MVEILGLAADIDHAVDRGGAAQHLAARPVDAAVAGAGIGLGLVAPIDAGIGEGLAKAERDVDPAVVVLAAGLEQQHLCRRALAQSRRHGAARRPRADHDEISFDRIRFYRHMLRSLTAMAGYATLLQAMQPAAPRPAQ